jgi:CTD kinase subunit alpha
LAPGPAKTGPLGNKPGLRQFFEAASPGNHQASASVANDSSAPQDADADMEIDPETPVSKVEPLPVEPPAEPREVSERKYNEYLDTVAPYLRSAFKEWLSQAQSTPLSAFLVHYFGRQPDAREMQTTEQLMVLREPLSKIEDVTLPQPSQSGAKDVSGGPSTHRDLPSTQHGTPISSESNGQRIENHLPETDSTISKLLPGEAYERLACVGEGTYGKVYKARRVEDGSFRALKRIRMEGEKDGFPVTAMREIKLLQSLKHENIIRLYEMMVSKGEHLRSRGPYQRLLNRFRVHGLRLYGTRLDGRPFPA